MKKIIIDLKEKKLNWNGKIKESSIPEMAYLLNKKKQGKKHYGNEIIIKNN